MSSIDYNMLAETLYESNFCLYGFGNFDISKKEVAEILEALFENKDIKIIYQKLYEKRMG